MNFTAEELKATSKLRNLEERKVIIARKKAELERKEALLNAALMGRSRKHDTSRKILLGAYVLSLISDDSNFRYKLYVGLNKYLVKERDRALFPELETEIDNLV